MYYNTTNEVGKDLQDNKDKALTQEQMILNIVEVSTEIMSDFTTSASVISSLDVFKKTPITSIRRAVTNLVDKGDLTYTGDKRSGLYGRNESIFKLNKLL
jgi:hypothetical protein